MAQKLHWTLSSCDSCGERTQTSSIITITYTKSWEVTSGYKLIFLDDWQENAQALKVNRLSTLHAPHPVAWYMYVEAGKFCLQSRQLIRDSHAPITYRPLSTPRQFVTLSIITEGRYQLKQHCFIKTRVRFPHRHRGSISLCLTPKQWYPENWWIRKCGTCALLRDQSKIGPSFPSHLGRTMNRRKSKKEFGNVIRMTEERKNTIKEQTITSRKTRWNNLNKNSIRTKQLWYRLITLKRLR